MNFAHLKAKKVLLNTAVETLKEAQETLDSNLSYFDFVMNDTASPTPVLVDELLFRIKTSFNAVVEAEDRVNELKNL